MNERMDMDAYKPQRNITSVQPCDRKSQPSVALIDPIVTRRLKLEGLESSPSICHKARSMKDGTEPAVPPAKESRE
jgi:hypothetical protein